jgi:hypothetical protein
MILTMRALTSSAQQNHGFVHNRRAIAVGYRLRGVNIRSGIDRMPKVPHWKVLGKISRLRAFRGECSLTVQSDTSRP